MRNCIETIPHLFWHINMLLILVANCTVTNSLHSNTTTVYILQLFHVQSACAHKILLCHNLIIFKLLNLLSLVLSLRCCLFWLTMHVVAGTGIWVWRLLWLRYLSTRLCHKIARFVHTLLFLCNLFRVELIIIKCFTLRQILFLCEYFPNANA